MTIFGVALLSICTLVGVFLGDLLGVVLGVKANVGGVGLAMMLLIAARVWLRKSGALSHGVKLGVEFWGTMYIPIVVAMAAQQNVVAALRGGPLVLVTAVVTVTAGRTTAALATWMLPATSSPQARASNGWTWVTTRALAAKTIAPAAGRTTVCRMSLMWLTAGILSTSISMISRMPIRIRIHGLASRS